MIAATIAARRWAVGAAEEETAGGMLREAANRDREAIVSSAVFNAARVP